MPIAFRHRAEGFFYGDSEGSVKDDRTTATALRCKECGRTGELTAAYVCDFCFGPLEVVYDMERIAARVSRSSPGTRLQMPLLRN